MDTTRPASSPLLSSVDAADRNDLPRDICDRAIGRYHESVREQSEVYRLAGGLRELEPWTDLASLACSNASGVLIRCIMAHSRATNAFRLENAEPLTCPSLGIRSGGKLYLVVPDHYSVGDDIGSPDEARLVVIDELSIVDVDGDCLPSASPSAPASPFRLTDGERTVLSIVSEVGEQEAIRRLCLIGETEPVQTT